jgi:uncharacterized protein YjlB
MACLEFGLRNIILKLNHIYMETAIRYSEEKIYHELIPANGNFPNNEHLPVLLYNGVLELENENSEKVIKQIFEGNMWGNAWTNGIFDYHHYHSITHEVLAVISGTCIVALGGSNEKQYHLEKGDVLILPAGVAHKNISSSPDFKCVGAYPGGVSYDIKRGKADEKKEAEKNIQKVPLPEKDPVYGKGPLQKFWKANL